VISAVWEWAVGGPGAPHWAAGLGPGLGLESGLGQPRSGAIRSPSAEGQCLSRAGLTSTCNPLGLKHSFLRAENCFFGFADFKGEGKGGQTGCHCFCVNTLPGSDAPIWKSQLAAVSVAGEARGSHQSRPVATGLTMALLSVCNLLPCDELCNLII